MKRILFYALLAVQLIVIVFLVIQFEQIDAKGRTITLETTQPYDYMDYQSDDDFLYVEYEANKINNDLWHDTESLEWGDRVYALLKSDADHLYHIEQASIQKLTATSDDEIVLIGNFKYEDEQQKFQDVAFGIEKINQLDQFGTFTNKKPLRITLKIGKWGQYKVTSIEEAN